MPEGETSEVTVSMAWNSYKYILRSQIFVLLSGISPKYEQSFFPLQITTVRSDKCISVLLLIISQENVEIAKIIFEIVLLLIVYANSCMSV